jgi:trimeric autotransporter adhesin
VTTFPASLLRGLRVLLVLALFLPGAGRAATLCVDSVSGLVQALDLFDTVANNTTLTVKLVQGTYAVGDSLGGLRDSQGRSVSLQLLGGYAVGTDCAGRTLNPGNTVIDGLNASGSALHFTGHGKASFLVEGITFTRLRGVTAGPWMSAALTLRQESWGVDTVRYEIRHCRFAGNSAAGAVLLSGAQMFFVNNLVTDNSLSDGSAAVESRYVAYAAAMLIATNNTIANNVGGGAGLRLDGHNQQSSRLSEIGNNIAYGNGGVDLQVLKFGANPLQVHSNVIGSSAGVGVQPGTIFGDPRFLNAPGGVYRLAADSPAINTGALQQTWGFPSRDLIGNKRIVGSRIDRGAYESNLDDATTTAVTTASDNGNNDAPLAGSLRAAIKSANAAAGPYRILFDIPGGCPRLLSLSTALPDILGDLEIDGSSQPGWSPNTADTHFDASLCLVLNGAGSGGVPWALRIPAEAGPSARLVVRGIAFAGFSDAAIRLDGGSGHRILGNQFGAVPFTAPNQRALRVAGESGGAFIGGFNDPAEINLFAGSSQVGVQLENAAGASTLARNLFGFQPDGVGHGGNGVDVHIFHSPGNLLQHNRFGNSSSHAVNIAGSAATGNRLQLNRFGTDRFDGAAGAGAATVLLSLGARNTTIGSAGTGTWGANLIEHSAGAGVWISTSGGSGNRVQSNGMFGNQGLDIDLAGEGPSPNQASNPQPGPNNLQNHPLLGSVLRLNPPQAAWSIGGSLVGAPSSAYWIDFYYAPSCNPPLGGRGRARIWIGRDLLFTDGGGQGSFTATPTFASALQSGYVSATATDVTGNTSELGACTAEVEATPGPDFRDGFEALTP